MPYGPDIIENTLTKEHPQLLELLLRDHSTDRNIFWATDSYEALGVGYQYADEITPERITGVHDDVIRPRALKSREEQTRRVKGMAEVFTPAWICRKMNDFADTQLWANLDKKKDWRTYVKKRCLELTCGEAPFLVSRYDSVSGVAIPQKERIGLLDRKLRIVGEMAAGEEYPFWALLAVASVYGYEWQGDNLLLAREAVVATFAEYYKERTGAEPPEDVLLLAAEIVSWNLWQMDGLKAVVPNTCHEVLPPPAPTLAGFELPPSGETLLEGFNPHARPCPGCEKDDMRLHNGVRCQLRRWVGADKIMTGEHNNALLPTIFDYIQTQYPMKFDFVIGNPPYQEETKDTSDKPVYDKFMSETYKVGRKVELITPARFLFNAGKTSKAWNEQMLNDEHLKVLYYQQDSSKVFRNTDIKGGVAVTYRDETSNFGAIEVFTSFPELNSILGKVLPQLKGKSLADIFFVQNKFDLDTLYNDYPQYKEIIGSGGKEKRLTASILYQLDLFTEKKRNENDVAILGVINNKRVFRYIPVKYLDTEKTNLKKWKVLVPKSNGSGAIGEVLSTPLIGEPLIGYTQTFLGIGCFDTKDEAEAAFKYIKTKFARTMLGVLKITQDNPPEKWRYVPLQDFTSNSDIDWSVSVKEIDRQLYKKYGLSTGEVAFIEEKVREME